MSLPGPEETGAGVLLESARWRICSDCDVCIDGTDSNDLTGCVFSELNGVKETDGPVVLISESFKKEVERKDSSTLEGVAGAFSTSVLEISLSARARETESIEKRSALIIVSLVSALVVLSTPTVSSGSGR